MFQESIIQILTKTDGLHDFNHVKKMGTSLNLTSFIKETLINRKPYGSQNHRRMYQLRCM
jgi:hypothetical protein